MDNLNPSADGALSGLEALLAGLETPAGSVEQTEAEVELADNSETLSVIEPEDGTQERTEEGTAIDAGIAAIEDQKALRAAQKAADKLAAEQAKAAKKLADTAARAAKREADAAAKQAKKEADAAEKASKQAAAKLKKEMAAAQKVIDDAAKPAPEAAAPAPAPKESTPRVFWGKNKLGRLEARLGEDVANVMLFNTDDLNLSPEDRTALIAGNKEFFKTLPVKVQDQATNLMEFVTGKLYRLNPSVDVTVKLLSKDHKLVAGDQGNLYQRLRVFYSIGSARSMGGATILALKALEIIKLGDKVGTWVPNPNSALLALLSNKLLLSFVDGDEALEALEAKEAAQREPAPVPVTISEPAPIVPEPVVNSEPCPVDAPTTVVEAQQAEDNSVMEALLIGLKGTVQPAKPAFEPALF